MPPTVGEILDEKYQVERILGEGGMGYVVAAWHAQLERHVALKLLRPETLAEAAFVARFEREARAAAKIKSEHVCRVLDVGHSPEHGPFMVMEHLEGDDLQSLLRRVGPRPIPQAVTWILHASHAIAEAHGRGIVHRDLKPANLFLTDQPDGEPLVKVLDFGISKLMDASKEVFEKSLTTTSMFMGSYAYMSPEQARSAKNVDGRVDVWALGAILQKIVSGATPFVADSPSAYIAKIVADPPARLRERCPDAPPELEAIILRCLEKDRDARFANVAELAQALAPFAPGTEPMVRAIARLCRATLAGGRPSATSGPLAPPQSVEAGGGPSPARPVGAPPRDRAPVPRRSSESSDTPTKPLDIGTLEQGLAAGSWLRTAPTSTPGGVPPSAPGFTPASAPGFTPASAPGFTPASAPDFTPGSASGFTPGSASGFTPRSAPGFAHSSDTQTAPLTPSGSPGLQPAGYGSPAPLAPQAGTTDASVAPWTPGSLSNAQPRRPRLAVWLAISGVALVLTVVVVLWIGLAASSSTPAAAAGSSEPSTVEAVPSSTPAGASAESGSPQAHLDAGPNEADAGQEAAEDSAAPSAEPTGTPSATPTSEASTPPRPLPKPAGQWDPFARP